MQYKVIFNDEKLLTKDFSQIPKQKLRIIFNKLERLSEYGIENSQIKKLKDYYLADYRLRVGDFRILFNLDVLNKKIIVFRILHRSKLY